MRGRVTALVWFIGLVSACAPTDSTDSQVLVAAASSLTDAFQELEVVFELANPGVDIVLNLAGSSELREQILNGAPTDVFASADLENMQQVNDAGLISTGPQTFATNRMVLAVAIGNPGRITGLDDFARPDALIGLCAERVPCGRYGRALLDAAGIVPAPDTNEPSVRALLAKLELAELDAGLVYASDVVAGAAVSTIPLTPDLGPSIEYSIAVLGRTAHPGPAESFLDFVSSVEGQGVLAKWGFGSP